MKLQIYKHIPNTITSLNLLSGCVAVTFAFSGMSFLIYTSVFIGLACVFDFLDGMSARTLKAYSEIGKELDSLADLVSFGLAPSVIVYRFLKSAFFGDIDFIASGQFTILSCTVLLAPYLLSVFSALRLAKFNLDTRQRESFIGLATPANAIFIASFPVLYSLYPQSAVTEFVTDKYFLLAFIAVQCFLLVSEIPMFSLKFKHLKWIDNEVRFLFLSSLIVLFLSVGLKGLVFVIPIYILLSLGNNMVKR